MAAALRDLKSYVMADTGAANQAESTVLLMVTHSNLSARFMEIRFDRFVRAPCLRFGFPPHPYATAHFTDFALFKFPSPPPPSHRYRT